MIELLSRIIGKFSRIWFTLSYGAKFRLLGQAAYMFRPFRIDGAVGIEIGDGTVVQRGGWLYCCVTDGATASLKIGKGCVFGYNNHITSARSVTIGDCVLTANNVFISDNIHEFEDIGQPVMYQPVRFKAEVIIGDGSWIGENVCIIGACIGKNSVIGANSVVTRDIPDYSVAVGSPAKVIRQYNQVTQNWENV